ncbi:SGNH/GDSL hydrolase family protein [Nocardia sp. NPDC058658]|uniref:SGNH/GDSL hydrolase family protein n=1 Tax=Nocardia sp. NPDC058658 TaxID=3346580 RepID=UPI003669CEBE
MTTDSSIDLPVRTESTDPYCLSDEAAAALLAGAPWTRFASIGDSLSAGTSDPSPGYRTLPWPERVRGVLQLVNPALVYLNTAEIGATTRKAIATQAERIVEFGPDLLHLPSGANDIFRPEPSYERIEDDLRELYGIAASTGATLTVFTLVKRFVVPRIPDFAERVSRVNAITRQLATEHGAVVIDTWDHPINERPDLLSADRIHLASAGQAVLAAEVVRALTSALNGVR